MNRPCRFSCKLIVALFSLSSHASVEASQSDIDSLLDLSLKELIQVEISTAGKTLQTSGEIPASVIIISRRDIKQYGYSSLEEVLNNIPGLYMTEDWAWSGSVNYGVRGVYSKSHFDNMAILVNGVSQMEDGKRGYPLEKINVPVQAIDRIEVIRGPMSVIYGSTAFLGAINIITNRQSDDNTDNILSVSEGDHSTSKRFARFSGEDGKFSFVMNLQSQQTDGPSYPYSDIMSDTSFLPTDWNLAEDAETVMASESQYFDFSGSFNDLNIYLSHINARANVIDSQPGVGSGSTGFTRSTNLSLNYSTQLNDEWQLKASGAFFYHNYFLDEEYNFSGFFSNNQSTTEAQEYEVNAVWTPSDSLHALFGVMHRHGQYKAYDDYPTLGLPNREIQVDEADGLKTYAVFSQLNYHANDQLTLVGGLRAEWQGDYRLSVFDNNIDINNQTVISRVFAYDDINYTYQLSTIYNIQTNQHIKLMYSTGEKAPAPSNNLSLTELSQPALEAEKTSTLEVNYIIARDNFFLQAGLFQNRVSNLIISSAILQNGVFESTLDNSGEMEVLGFELSTTLQLSRAFKLNFDTSLHDVTDNTPGYENIEPAYAPKNISNLRATYSFNDDTHLSLLGHYTGPVLPEWRIASTGASLEQRIANGSRTGEKIDSYSSFDLNLLFENLYTDNLDFNIKIGNLGDETIRYPTINNRVFDKGTIGLDRHILATLEYAF